MGTPRNQRWKIYFFLTVICGIALGVMTGRLVLFTIETSTPRVGGRVGPGIGDKIEMAVFFAVLVLGYICIMYIAIRLFWKFANRDLQDKE
jgi:hypothetical protein